MSAGDWVFWATIVGLGFALALALQLRYFAGLALRLALGERLPDTGRRELGDVLETALGSGRAPALDSAKFEAEAARLQAEYPAALAQLRWARRICLLVPFAIAVLLIARRFLSGGL